MPKPDSVSTHETWHRIKAKDVPIGRTMSVGGRSYRVLSNEKNKIGGRVLKLEPFASGDNLITLIVPRSTRMTVSKHKHKRNYKKK